MTYKIISPLNPIVTGCYLLINLKWFSCCKNLNSNDFFLFFLEYTVKVHDFLKMIKSIGNLKFKFNFIKLRFY